MPKTSIMLQDRAAPQNASAPLYQQLYASLRTAILAGELKPGAKMASTRALAAQLNLSRNTVLNAYEQLLAEGLLESAQGSGTFVARALPAGPLAPTRRGRAASRAPAAPPEPMLAAHARLQLAAPQMFASLRAGSAPPMPFSFGMPALEAFPLALWSRLVIQQARQLTPGNLAYQDAAGYRPLCEAIAAHAALARQVRCTPEQVVIVPGSQGGLDLAARVLLNAGDPVWMEDPGYLAARGAFQGAGARLVPVPVDEEGLVVEAGLARAPRARLAYVTPSHQFPLGVTLSLGRRLALLAWARQANAYILEDDYDSEFRFAGRPLAALQGIDDAGAERVIYVGTFSKILFPALRCGYLILPPPLVDTFLAVRRLIDVHPPLLEQAALARFVADGHLTRHLRRMRALYAERRGALLAATRTLPLEIQSPAAGMYCVGWLPPGLDGPAAAQAAAAHGVALTPVSQFSLEPMRRQGVVLGFSEHAVPDIEAAAGRLGAALRSAMH